MLDAVLPKEIETEIDDCIRSVMLEQLHCLDIRRISVNCTKTGLAKLDICTRNKFNMNGGFHRRAKVTKLYLPRKEDGRGLGSVENYVESTSVDTDSYEVNSEESLRRS